MSNERVDIEILVLSLNFCTNNIESVGRDAELVWKVLEMSKDILCDMIIKNLVIGDLEHIVWGVDERFHILIDFIL